MKRMITRTVLIGSLGIAMCSWLFSGRTVWAQEGTVDRSTYAYLELGGKGFISGNVDFQVVQKIRLTAGVTMLDYALEDPDTGEESNSPWPSPSVMVMNLFGSGPRYFELGAGVSMSPRPGADYRGNDSAWSYHGVIGYRYQKPDRVFFRIGFTPFYRVNWVALPLIGISLGRSF